jgi:AraC-like DNA-binding protein
MGYDYIHIAGIVLAKLKVNPRITLRQVVLETGASRHTLTRALQRVVGASFRACRDDEIRSSVQAALQQREGRFVKELAAAVGYAPSSFSRRVRAVNKPSRPNEPSYPSRGNKVEPAEGLRQRAAPLRRDER